MKEYIKKAVSKLKNSDDLKETVILESGKDCRRNFLSLGYNKIILSLQRKMVPCRLKNMILRTTGMKVGYDACVPHDIYLDPYFPELIFLEAGCLVGGGSRLLTHKTEGNKLILGKCIVAERALMGGCSDMLPGSAISKNSILMFFSELKDKMREGTLYGGKPAKEIMKFSKEDIEKYFGESDGNYKKYYAEFKKKVRQFRKDKNQTYLKIQYNGNRLNAGDDWWRARNILRIFYNGVIIEITRLLPHCFLKTLLLRMAGVKLGKKVRIGKGAVFDHIYCDNITVEDNVIIGEDVYLDGHEYTISQTVFGKSLIKKGAVLKKGAYVRTGTTIGENTIIEECGMAQREIPANEVWGGNPAKFIRKRK